MRRKDCEVNYRREEKRRERNCEGTIISLSIRHTLKVDYWDLEFNEDIDFALVILSSCLG